MNVVDDSIQGLQLYQASSTGFTGRLTHPIHCCCCFSPAVLQQKQHMAALLNKTLPSLVAAGQQEAFNEQDSNRNINFKYDHIFINRIMASDSSKRSISSSTIRPYISPTPRTSSSSWGDIIPTYRSLSTTCSNMTTYYHATNINKIEIISNAITIARSRRCLSSSSCCITTSSQSGFRIWSSKEELAHALNTGNVVSQVAAESACGSGQLFVPWYQSRLQVALCASHLLHQLPDPVTCGLHDACMHALMCDLT